MLLLETLFTRMQNSNTIIKTGLIGVSILYFIEGWELTRIIPMILVVIGVFLFLNRDLINTTTPMLNGTIGVPEISKKESEKHTKQTHKVEQIVNTQITPKVKKLDKELQQFGKETNEIIDYVYKMKTISNAQDTSYNKLLKELLELTKSFVRQINILTQELPLGLYPHLTYQKIKDCQKEINTQIGSINYKISMDQYMELALLIEKYENATENITDKLAEYINTEFSRNPQNGISPIDSGAPTPFDVSI